MHPGSSAIDRASFAAKSRGNRWNRAADEGGKARHAVARIRAWRHGSGQARRPGSKWRVRTESWWNDSPIPLGSGPGRIFHRNDVQGVEGGRRIVPAQNGHHTHADHDEFRMRNLVPLAAAGFQGERSESVRNLFADSVQIHEPSLPAWKTVRKWALSTRPRRCSFPSRRTAGRRRRRPRHRAGAGRGGSLRRAPGSGA